MYSKYSKIVINVILALALFIVQIAFISGLPGWFSNLNLILVVLIFILVLNSFRIAWWWSAGLGLLLDIYSFFPFGLFLISLTTAVFITNFLLNNFFTNRSLYSFLALTFFATLSYKLILFFLAFMAACLNISSVAADINIGVLINELPGLAINIIVTIFIYYFLNLISARLKPVFLLKNKG